MPPYLAGRDKEKAEFTRLLRQDTILENLILTGLRGVGKTVLLDTFKPIAQEAGWLWVGNDLSEASSLTEQKLSVRLLTDLALVTSAIAIGQQEKRAVGLVQRSETVTQKLDFAALSAAWTNTPGLPSDKLKEVLRRTWEAVEPQNIRGVVFAYDEAQNLSDHATKEEYPVSLLLDVFQSIQRMGIPFMLVLVGLPTLFPRLVESRTFSERMFHLVVLEPLTKHACGDAIVKPIEEADCPVHFSPDSVDLIYQITRGYPYFVQYVCRETFDVWALHVDKGFLPPIPIADILRKLDADFFAGRWARATDRQRDLLSIIAHLKTSGAEFTVQEIVEASKEHPYRRPFSPSHVSQMLGSLGDAGLVYKNRWGKYSLAVPLLDEFIRRQEEQQNKANQARLF